ncbi:MAG TPA: hypothetical protein VHA12_00150 [Candidatus Nanoarchaeia archaeon]|nr:hypothetical protein [Candidatus Nanoarchaeia archaeon]
MIDENYYFKVMKIKSIRTKNKIYALFGFDNGQERKVECICFGLVRKTFLRPTILSKQEMEFFDPAELSVWEPVILHKGVITSPRDFFSFKGYSVE